MTKLIYTAELGSPLQKALENNPEALQQLSEVLEMYRKEGREEMKKECIKAIDKRIEEMDKDFDKNQPFISEAHGIYNLISSL